MTFSCFLKFKYSGNLRKIKVVLYQYFLTETDWYNVFEVVYHNPDVCFNSLPLNDPEKSKTGDFIFTVTATVTIWRQGVRTVTTSPWRQISVTPGVGALGGRCENQRLCKSDTCQNNGTCVDSSDYSSFTCDCLGKNFFQVDSQFTVKAIPPPPSKFSEFFRWICQTSEWLFLKMLLTILIL